MDEIDAAEKEMDYMHDEILKLRIMLVDRDEEIAELKQKLSDKEIVIEHLHDVTARKIDYSNMLEEKIDKLRG